MKPYLGRIKSLHYLKDLLKGDPITEEYAIPGIISKKKYKKIKGAPKPTKNKK